MKQGDQVSTPNGPGVFFEFHEKDPSKAYVRLKEPTENKVWHPIIAPGHPLWECIPCDEFNIVDLTVTKTVEQRVQEAKEASMRARAKQQAAMAEKLRRQQEEQRNAYEQQASRGHTQN